MVRTSPEFEKRRFDFIASVLQGRVGLVPYPSPVVSKLQRPIGL